MFFPAAKLSEPRLHLFGDRLCETDVGEWALRERERERERGRGDDDGVGPPNWAEETPWRSRREAVIGGGRRCGGSEKYYRDCVTRDSGLVQQR